jgi:hypothetical protein
LNYTYPRDCRILQLGFLAAGSFERRRFGSAPLVDGGRGRCFGSPAAMALVDGSDAALFFSGGGGDAA